MMTLVDILERLDKSEPEFKIRVYPSLRDVDDEESSHRFKSQIRLRFKLLAEYEVVVEALKAAVSSHPDPPNGSSIASRPQNYVVSVRVSRTSEYIDFDYERSSVYLARGACVRFLDEFVRGVIQEKQLKSMQ